MIYWFYPLHEVGVFYYFLVIVGRQRIESPSVFLVPTGRQGILTKDIAVKSLAF